MPFCFLPRYLLSPGALYVPWELKKCAQPGLLASSYLNPSLQTTDERERVKWNDKQFIQWFKEAQMYIWITVEKGRWDETQDVDLMWAIPERAAAISVKLSSHSERKKHQDQLWALGMGEKWGSEMSQDNLLVNTENRELPAEERVSMGMNNWRIPSPGREETN